VVYILSVFSSSKCSLLHNSNVFGSCIIRILYTGCAKIKKKFRRQKLTDVRKEGSASFFRDRLPRTPTRPQPYTTMLLANNQGHLDVMPLFLYIRTRRSPRYDNFVMLMFAQLTFMLFNIRSGGNEVGVVNGMLMSEQRSEVSLPGCCITATCDTG